MRIDPEDLKCVAFVCDTRKDRITPIATAFLVLVQIKPSGALTHHFYYWVTAEHIINNIECEPILRINRKNGSPYEWKTQKTQWRMHADSDVAAATFHVSDEIWAELDVQEIDTAIFVRSDYTVGRREDIPLTETPPDIGVGDDVLFFGLFAQHHGIDKNLPIVRFGNIARMPTEEKIEIEIDNYPTHREIIAYLVEARSWGGQSGSPAVWQAEFTFIPKEKDASPKEKKKIRMSALLGVVSSHFDIKQRAESGREPIKDITTRLNTGVAIVAPAHAIEELIMNNPEFKEDRATRLKGSDANRPMATADPKSPQN